MLQNVCLSGRTNSEHKYPRLIVCNISGYGRPGPYRDKKAYDLLIQSEAGLLSITGTEEEPSKAGISVADIAGGMYAYSAILTAILMRQRTGNGTTIEISLLEALSEWMGYPAYYTNYGGTAPGRTGASHAAIAPYGPFQSRDRNPVFLSIQNEREWERFCSIVLEQGNWQPILVQFRTCARQSSGGTALGNRESFRTSYGSRDHERLEKAQIANARMNTMQEFLHHPQLAAQESVARCRFSCGKALRVNSARRYRWYSAGDGTDSGSRPAYGSNSQRNRI